MKPPATFRPLAGVRRIVGVLAAVAFLVAQPPAPQAPRKPESTLVLPNIEISKSVLILYSKAGEKEAEIRFDSQKAGGREVSFVSPRASLLMKDATLQLSSPRGKFNQATRRLTLDGGVSASRSDGAASFTTDRLDYNATDKTIEGDGILDLHWQGLHITGRKFHMDVSGKTFIMEKEVQVELAAQP